MITKKVLLVDNNMDNSDWVKANAFDFPSVVTVDDFMLQFNVPSVEPARSERLAKLRDYPWAQATPKPIYDLLFADALDKASFGGDRSEAGRYAANIRWQNRVDEAKDNPEQNERFQQEKIDGGPRLLLFGRDSENMPITGTPSELRKRYGMLKADRENYFGSKYGVKVILREENFGSLAEMAQLGALQALEENLVNLKLTKKMLSEVSIGDPPPSAALGRWSGLFNFDTHKMQISSAQIESIVEERVEIRLAGDFDEYDSISERFAIAEPPDSEGDIYSDIALRSGYATMVHEFGHVVDSGGNKFMQASSDRNAGTIDSAIAPSGYGAQSKYEKVAESYAQWWLFGGGANQKVLEILFSERENVVKAMNEPMNLLELPREHPVIVYIFAHANKIAAFDFAKASFGGDRSAAGRYAANMRWQNNAQNKGTGFLGEPANIGVLELTRGEAMFVQDAALVMEADLTPDNGNDGKANSPDVAAKRTVLKGILAGMADVSLEDFVAADAALGGGKTDKATVKEVLVQHLIDTWASTSNDHNPASLMIQQVVKKTFGLTDTLEMTEMGGFYDADIFSDADIEDKKAVEKLAANPALEKVLTAFVKAQYANTQAYLANKGITEVALQRGMDSPKIREALRDFRMAHFERMIENGEIELKDSYEGENRNDDIAGNIDDAEFEETVPVGFLNARIKMRPLSSFTTKPLVADNFAANKDDGVVFTMTVPAKQIFSMPFTGVGCLREREMVVLGGKQKAQFAENSNYDQDLDYDDMFRPSDPDRAQDF